MKVTDEEFVKIWQKAESFKEVCEKSGARAIQEVWFRAAYFRRHGVPLKQLAKTKSRPVVDFVALAQVADAER